METLEPGIYNGIRVTNAFNPLISQIKPLDIFLVGSNDFIGHGIRKVSISVSPDRHCEFNHAGIFMGYYDNTLECAWNLESFEFFSHHQNKRAMIGRVIGLEEDKALRTIYDLRKHIDQDYPISRIALHFFNLAHIFHWERLVCSEYVAKLLFYIGERHHNYFGTVPDHLADEIRSSLNNNRTGPKYEIIFDGKTPINLYYWCENCKAFILMPSNTIFKCPICTNETRLVNFPGHPTLDSKVREYNDYWIEELIT